MKILAKIKTYASRAVYAVPTHRQINENFFIMVPLELNGLIEVVPFEIVPDSHHNILVGMGFLNRSTSILNLSQGTWQTSFFGLVTLKPLSGPSLSSSITSSLPPQPTSTEHTNPLSTISNPSPAPGQPCTCSTTKITQHADNFQTALASAVKLYPSFLSTFPETFAQQQVASFLQEFPTLFVQDSFTGGTLKVPPVRVELKPNAVPERSKTRPLSHKENLICREWVNKSLGENVIERSSDTQWVSGIFPVPKPDKVDPITKETKKQWRIVTPFFNLNTKVNIPGASTPNQNDIKCWAAGFTHFSVIDLHSGF